MFIYQVLKLGIFYHKIKTKKGAYRAKSYFVLRIINPSNFPLLGLRLAQVKGRIYFLFYKRVSEIDSIIIKRKGCRLLKYRIIQMLCNKCAFALSLECYYIRIN